MPFRFPNRKLQSLIISNRLRFIRLLFWRWRFLCSKSNLVIVLRNHFKGFALRFIVSANGITRAVSSRASGLSPQMSCKLIAADCTTNAVAISVGRRPLRFLSKSGRVIAVSYVFEILFPSISLRVLNSRTKSRSHNDGMNVKYQITSFQFAASSGFKLI